MSDEKRTDYKCEYENCDYQGTEKGLVVHKGKSHTEDDEKDIVKVKIKELEKQVSVRWANFFENYLKTGKPKQSAIDAGFAKSYAEVITDRFPDKVKKSLTEALEAKGITSDKIAGKIGELLDAERQVVIQGKVDRQPDYTAIDKGITHATKVRGDVKDSDKPSKHLHIHFDISDLDEKQKLEFIKTGRVSELQKSAK